MRVEGRKFMGKVIIKTALVTLGSLLAAILILVAALTMFTPRTMSQVFDELGGKKISLWYMELSFQKSGEADDLAALFIKSVEVQDRVRTEKYGKILAERDDFDVICAGRDEQSENPLLGQIPFAYYVYGNIAEAVYVLNGAEAAVNYAAENTPESYPPYNALQTLLYLDGAADDAELLVLLTNALARYDGAEAAADFAYLQSLL